MYAGFLTHKHTSNFLGAHQRLDKISHRILLEHIAPEKFPKMKALYRFEGVDGPDGIKMKSPSQNELWHYIDPDNENDTKLTEILELQIKLLATALFERNVERAAFEAAWLAHGIVDGLTPAHQFPYEQAMTEATGLDGSQRTSKAKKIIARGDGKLDTLNRNWKIWGTKGLMVSHHGFEIGVATIILPRSFSNLHMSDARLQARLEQTYTENFKQSVDEVAKLHMYERFIRRGWNTALARDARETLVPSIVSLITEAWYRAVVMARENS